MTTTIAVLWWVTLGLALVLTLVAASYLAAVVRVCGQIRELARITLPSAVGIARNTSALANVQLLIDLAPTLLSTGGNIDATAEKLASTLETVANLEEGRR